MKILFNCTINNVGGAVQNAANFVKYGLRDDRHEFLFLVSFEVMKILQRWGCISDKIICIQSPARNKESINLIKGIEHDFSPDIVYTMAGPTYVKFSSKHVMGISDPYITHSDFKTFFINRSFIEAFKFFFKEKFKGFLSRLTADYFLFQTFSSRSGFCKKYFLPSTRTSVISNAIGEGFNYICSSSSNSNDGVFKVFVPSAYYPHKNLQIILNIAKKISKDDVKIKFITAAEKGSVFDNLVANSGLNSYVVNIGSYSYNDAIEHYNNADCIFMPSILETFSTSFLEAIALGKPLIVADRDFSREICEGYAIYYPAFSAMDAYAKILSVMNGDFLTKDRLRMREAILKKYGDQKDRYEKILQLLVGLNKEDL